jgi:formylglycine-generating enzyme required for sulfatase activity/pimeloyl-ACP methyl ester carboxylesterase
LPQLLQELKRRKVFRVLIAYLVASWLLLQVADVLSSILSLPEWAPKLVFFLLAVGIVPALILAWAYELTPQGIQRDEEARQVAGNATPGRFREVMLAAGLLLAIAAGGGLYWISNADERWAHKIALPQLEQQIATDQWEQAYATAMAINERLPDAGILDDYWAQFSFQIAIPSTPAGATVHRRAYDDPDAEWQLLGETPIYDVAVPRGFSLIRLDKDGFDSVLRIVGRMPIDGMTRHLAAVADPSGTRYVIPAVDIVLDPREGEAPASDVRVPGQQIFIDGQPVNLADFRIGRYEVTNREYREFVNAGGYKRPDYWEYEFVRNGEVLSWESAMAAFTDTTGRPGPATWIGGAYPEGQGEFPVGGISWYEAMAYARFARAEVPTVHHWRQAHAVAALTWQVPASNIDTSGVAPVGQYPGVGWTGTLDMLGNVREWCLNAVGENRAIVGGAWDEAQYMVQGRISAPSSLPPFDRSPTNGVRLAHSRDERDVREKLQQAVNPAEKPVLTTPASDEVFAAFLGNFDQGAEPLNASVDGTESIGQWRRQRISFDRGDGERIDLLLYLPDSDAGRHPTVLYWPSALARLLNSLDNYRLPLDFMLRNGWAVALPVLEATFYRERASGSGASAVARRDLFIRQVREMRRTIDYLETRPDLDTGKLSLYGFSWGGSVGSILLALEPRLKVGVLNQAGYWVGGSYDIDVAHYLPRVQQPVLQFNGYFDETFRYEHEAKPYFDLLGSESKKHVVEPTGHFAPNSVVIRETLAWLDQHLGDSGY